MNKQEQQRACDSVLASELFRFGNPTPTPRPAFKLTVLRPGRESREVVVLGHVKLAEALYHIGAPYTGQYIVKIESVSA